MTHSPQELRHRALAKDVLMLSHEVGWFDDERVKRACDALGWSRHEAKKWVADQMAEIMAGNI